MFEPATLTFVGFPQESDSFLFLLFSRLSQKKLTPKRRSIPTNEILTILWKICRVSARIQSPILWGSYDWSIEFERTVGNDGKIVCPSAIESREEGFCSKSVEMRLFLKSGKNRSSMAPRQKSERQKFYWKNYYRISEPVNLKWATVSAQSWEKTNENLKIPGSHPGLGNLKNTWKT